MMHDRAKIEEQRASRTTLVEARGVRRSGVIKKYLATRRRVVARIAVRANDAVQPTACAVAKKVNAPLGVAPASADGWRWADQ